MDIMAEAARQQEHVMNDPAPSVNLIDFADNGILLELLVWLDAPEVSQATLRSKINMEIWREFQKSGIEIPFPQREVRIKP
jgi:small-conductance mechanosensitive channel